MFRNHVAHFISRVPDAVAIMHGSAQYPGINGLVKFYKVRHLVMVVAEVEGLPVGRGDCDSPIFAFHIHEGGSCTGNDEDLFANAKMHYNPAGCPHPHHAGDLPPLFSAGGVAFLAVLTDRFDIDEILGRTVVIHDSFDDFSTQPAGNAGEKIACGEIVEVRR